MTIDATNPINSSTSSNNIAKEEAKIKEKMAKEKTKDEAKELVNLLSGNYSAANPEVTDLKSKRKDLAKNLETQYNAEELTKEEYEAAKKYLNSRDFKKAEKAKIEAQANVKENTKKTEEQKAKDENNSAIRQHIIKLAGKTDETKDRKISKDVKKALKEEYREGDITKEEYKDYKKFARKRSGFLRFLGVKEKESDKIYRSVGNRNKVEQTKAEGPEFKDKVQAKLNVAGFDVEDLYEIYDKNGGAADGTINYSWKKKQPGETDAVLAALNKNEGGYEFDKKDVKEIGKALGYTVEKKVDGGKVVRDIARGAILGAPASYFKIGNNVNVATSVAGVGVDTSTKLIGFGPAIGAAVGGTASAITQAHRVEDRAMPTNVPEGITTYDEYAKYLDSYSTEKGAAIGKDIAKFYIDKDGKTLMVDKMNKDLSKAAGTEGSTSTPLNYEEAYGLLSDLVTGKNKVEQTKPEVKNIEMPKIELGEIKVLQNNKIVEQELPTECYEVKSGDNWYAVVMGKYKPDNAADAKALVRYLKDAYYNENKEALNKLGVTSSKGAFFPRVGEELCIPAEISLPNGKKYTFNHDGKVIAGDLGGNTVSYKAKENPYRTIGLENRYAVKATANGEQKAYIENLKKEQLEQAIDSVRNANSDYIFIRK